jgi:hypothetical protein
MGQQHKNKYILERKQTMSTQKQITITDGFSFDFTGKEGSQLPSGNYAFIGGQWYKNNMACPTGMVPMIMTEAAVLQALLPADTAQAPAAKPATRVTTYEKLKTLDGLEIGLFFINPDNSGKGAPYKGAFTIGGIQHQSSAWPVITTDDKGVKKLVGFNLKFQTQRPWKTIFINNKIAIGKGQMRENKNQPKATSPKFTGTLDTYDESLHEYVTYAMSGWVSGSMINLGLSKIIPGQTK